MSHVSSYTLPPAVAPGDNRHMGSKREPVRTQERQSSKTRAVPDGERKARGDRAEKLRERRGLTQQAAAIKSGILSREEITKLETGVTLGSTTRFQQGISRAYGVPLELVEAYLRGDRELDDVLSHGTGENGWTHYGNIEAALSYHGERWHPVTIATGRALALCYDDDPGPPEWATLLDRIETTLATAKLLPTR